MDASPSLDTPADLFAAMADLRRHVLTEGEALLATWQPRVRRADFADGAANLAWYLALRRRDLRPLQAALSRWGLSSLGRSEARVKPTLDAVVATLGAICRADDVGLPPYPTRSDLDHGAATIEREAAAIVGPATGERDTRIMVTLPPEAADDPALLAALVARGVECVRINCAHDAPAAWAAMIDHLRRAERAANRAEPVRVLMDLGGPKVRTLRPRHAKHRFVVGDRALLARDLSREPADDLPRVGCTLATAIDQVAVGAQVWFDDGQIGSRVVDRSADGAVVQITHAPPAGKAIRPEKGINFPDTDLAVAPLTDKDRLDLDFVARHADMVGYSFVQSAEDVALLLDELRRRAPDGGRMPALVLKIETRRAVRNLPEIIVQAAGHLPTAVMIARGDLAVELGFERMAEIQEEILWLCEAAHIPVIWATQVLERLAKEGVPTRAEVTDAAAADRAECVMLNKGPFILDAVRVLDDVLLRMQAHQRKKSPQLRALRSWQDLFEDGPTSPGAPTTAAVDEVGAQR